MQKIFRVRAPDWTTWSRLALPLANAGGAGSAGNAGWNAIQQSTALTPGLPGLLGCWGTAACTERKRVTAVGAKMHVGDRPSAVEEGTWPDELL